MNSTKSSTRPREYLLNADFDGTLAPGAGPSLLETADHTFLHEMAWHFLFGPGQEDSLIVYGEPPVDFLEYLSGKGFTLPRLVRHPDFTPGAEFTPFGWNAHAESLAARYEVPSAHPDLRLVKIANSRAFGLELEREYAVSPTGFQGGIYSSLAAAESFLVSRSEPLGYMVKGDHGHAGTANRRVPSGPLTGEDRRILELIFNRHGRAVVEPWHERILDMSVNFRVDRHGGVRDFRGHVLINSRDGAFLGVKILPTRRPPEPWDAPLEASAADAAVALDGLGYSGPVSMDAYLWNSPQGPRLRPMVDINARLSMALPAHGLADRLPGKTLLWMWSKPRKLNLPADYAALEALLGPHAFRRETGVGILAVSPLMLPGDARSLPRRPKRVGFLMSAEDEGGLAILQGFFARALGRI